MIHEKARIVAVGDSGKMTAKVDRKGACESCKLKAGCGQKLLIDMGSRSCIEVEVENTLGAQEGDIIEIGIPENALITASMVMYMLPLLTMILGTVVAHLIFRSDSEIPVMIGAGLGLLGGFLTARIYSSQTKSQHYKPSSLRILDEA